MAPILNVPKEELAKREADYQKSRKLTRDVGPEETLEATIPPWRDSR